MPLFNLSCLTTCLTSPFREQGHSQDICQGEGDPLRVLFVLECTHACSDCTVFIVCFLKRPALWKYSTSLLKKASLKGNVWMDTTSLLLENGIGEGILMMTGNFHCFLHIKLLHTFMIKSILYNKSQ